MQRHALVVLNGEASSRELLAHLASQADLVVAADGGANILRKYRIRADVVIGDFDSITPATRRHFSKARVIRIPDQDSTDLEKSFNFLIHEGITDVAVVGMAGGRIDFTLGNFVSIWKYAPQLTLSFFGDDWFAVSVANDLDLSLPIGTTVSLIPFSRCTGVTLRGFRYPLKNATMNYGSLGVSNITKAHRASIGVRGGNLLVVVLR